MVTTIVSMATIMTAMSVSTSMSISVSISISMPISVSMAMLSVVYEVDASSTRHSILYKLDNNGNNANSSYSNKLFKESVLEVTHMVGGSSSSADVVSDCVDGLLSASIVVGSHGACATTDH